MLSRLFSVKAGISSEVIAGLAHSEWLQFQEAPMHSDPLSNAIPIAEAPTRRRPNAAANVKTGSADVWDLSKQRAAMKQLVEDIAKALVELADGVALRLVEGEQTTVLELRVAPSDTGKVIGKQGRTAHSIRIILRAVGMKISPPLYTRNP